MKKFIVIAALIVIAAAGYYISSNLLSQSVIVAPVRIDEAIHAVPGSIRVEADYATEIRSGETGRVLEVLTDEGQSIYEGDIVAEIDPRDLLLEIESREIDLRAAQKQQEIGNPRRFALLDAEERFAEAKRLKELGQYSQDQVTKAERNLQSAQESYDSAALEEQTRIDKLKNMLEVLNRRLEKMTVRTAIDGIVNEVLIHKGDLIREGAPVATIVSEKRNVIAELSEENFNGIQLGQSARVRFLSYGTQTYDGKITKIYPTADPQTQRYKLELEVDIPQERLVPGLTGEVSILLAQRPDAKLIPTRALMGDRVFVVKDGKLEYRKVAVGFRSLTQVEILKGLEAGELVVVEDLDKYRDGDRVVVTNEKEADDQDA